MDKDGQNFNIFFFFYSLRDLRRSSDDGGIPGDISWQLDSSYPDDEYPGPFEPGVPTGTAAGRPRIFEMFNRENAGSVPETFRELAVVD